jgi:DNA (cytosine-5)-methyltransferase 1
MERRFVSASSYHLPTVSAIRQIPPNGLKVVSTFSGGGGTCLGMMLAGYEVVWANDCDPHARETYTANLGKPIDGRLLNDVTAADILAETGLKEGELDVFEGSPPCTKFSTAGRRQKGWNRKEIHAGTVQANTEDLFFEWLRLARGLRPKVFVAENVSGLVKGVAKGYFKLILKEMKSLGYQVTARLLNAQWLGVPQHRNRIIFIGVRDDLSRMPVFPAPLPRRWTVRQAIGDLLISSSFTLKDDVGSFDKSPDTPADAIVAQDAMATQNSDRGRNMIEISGHIQMKSPQNTSRHSLDAPSPNTPKAMLQRSGAMFGEESPREYSLETPAPTVKATGWDLSIEVEQIVGNDRYVPKWGNLDQTHPTLTSEGPNGSQGQMRYKTIRRHLTIPEVKRICSFPDDYVLDGSFGKQWARLGNAVPPMMAYHIARAIRTGVFCRGVGGRIL